MRREIARIAPKGDITGPFDKVLDARVRAGAALSELDVISQGGSAMDLQLQSRLSELNDVDYAKAASDLAQRQLVLQAAQQAYAKMFTTRSLFDLI